MEGLHAVAIAGSHLEAFQDALRAAGHDPLYVKKHSTTVRAMFNKGVRMGWLPQGGIVASRPRDYPSGSSRGQHATGRDGGRR